MRFNPKDVVLKFNPKDVLKNFYAKQEFIAMKERAEFKPGFKPGIKTNVVIEEIKLNEELDNVLQVTFMDKNNWTQNITNFFGPSMRDDEGASEYLDSSCTLGARRMFAGSDDGAFDRRGWFPFGTGHRVFCSSYSTLSIPHPTLH